MYEKKDITESLLKDLRTNLIEIKNSFEVGKGSSLKNLQQSK